MAIPLADLAGYTPGSLTMPGTRFVQAQNTSPILPSVPQSTPAPPQQTYNFPEGWTAADILNSSGLNWSQITADPKYRPLVEGKFISPGIDWGEGGAETVIDWNKIPAYQPKGLSAETLQHMGEKGMHFMPTNVGMKDDLVNPKLVWEDPNYGMITVAGNSKNDSKKSPLDTLGPLAMTLITMGAGAPIAFSIAKLIQSQLVSMGSGQGFNPVGAGVSLGSLAANALTSGG